MNTRGMLIGSATMTALVIAQTATADMFDKFFDKLTNKAEQKVQQRIEQRVDQGLNKAVDMAEGTINCVVTDQTCIQKAKEDGKKLVLTDTESHVVADPNAPGDKTGR
ncbi:MAG: hypothetical protein ACREJU_16570 [Nitrospiraceae bacterium]